jgi:hypothetical protein
VPAFQFVCPPHRQRFIELVEGEGCRDRAAMEQVRRLLLAWLSERYPRLVLESFNSESCMGCALNAACIDLTDMYAAIRQASRAARSPAGGSGCVTNRESSRQAEKGSLPARTL